MAKAKGTSKAKSTKNQDTIKLIKSLVVSQTGVKSEILRKDPDGGFPSLDMLHVYRQADGGNSLWRKDLWLTPAKCAAIVQELPHVLTLAQEYREQASARAGVTRSDQELLTDALDKVTDGKRLNAAESRVYKAWLNEQRKTRVGVK